MNTSLSVCVDKFNSLSKFAYEREFSEDASMSDYINTMAQMKDDCCQE